MAGERWHAFVQWTLAQGLSGLENLSLIPGFVGAAPVQNIGAYGVEMAATCDSVMAIDTATGEPEGVSPRRLPVQLSRQRVQGSSATPGMAAARPARSSLPSPACAFACRGVLSPRRLRRSQRPSCRQWGDGTDGDGCGARCRRHPITANCRTRRCRAMPAASSRILVVPAAQAAAPARRRYPALPQYPADATGGRSSWRPAG